MSEIKLISPLLDNINMGDPISDRCGVRACPAMTYDGDSKYIVKVISTPATRTQMDALLLSGAYSSEDAALTYFKELADGIVSEAQILQKLSGLEGFVGFVGWQTEILSNNEGYNVYLLSSYKKSLERILSGPPITHLAALNLGMDLCAALSVCRQCGYLYVALKPSNIYMASDNSFKIGDIGFIKLDSLKYASLPDRYRSAYTPPEIEDAYSSLNTTLDTYAVGMILYQVFNGGQLPQVTDELLAAPDYADYEMSEIILKACARNPEERWQDPNDLCQALIGYMQRNGAHDSPIIPQAQTVVPEESETALNDEDQSLEEHPNDDGTVESDNTAVQEEPAAVINEDCDDSDQAPPVATDEVTVSKPCESDQPEAATEEETEEAEVETETDDQGAETDFTDLAPDSPISEPVDDTCSDEVQTDETLPCEEDVSTDYQQLSAEVSDILNQADELISHPTPEPVISPEPIDVPVPEPIVEEKPETESEEASETPPEETDSQESAVETVNIHADEDAKQPQEDTFAKNEQFPEEAEYSENEAYKPKSHWLRNTILILLLLGIIATGVLFYKNYYIQTVDNLKVIGGVDELTVILTTDIDDELLSVICADIYGNKQVLVPTDGRVTFKNLAPNTAYTVRLEMEGFHKLTGNVTGSYATPKRTNIAQFQARTGYEDGSVILDFDVDGTDSEQWKIIYSAEGVAPQEAIFAEHKNNTISGLQIGKEYTFTLEPLGDITIDGTTSITHTVSKVIRALDLKVAGIVDGTLTVSWLAPEDVSGISWSIRCYNNDGYDQTVTTNECTAEFTDVTIDQSYTVEVKAAGMSVTESITVLDNTLTVGSFQINDIDLNGFTLSWTANGTAKQGWKVQYTINASSTSEISVQETAVRIEPYIPGATYRIVLLQADETPVFNNTYEYIADPAAFFSGHGVTAEDMEFMMCDYPGYRGWSHHDLSYSDYTTTFSVGDSASFVVRLHVGQYGVSDEEINISYVIFDENGCYVDIGYQTSEWSDLWYRYYGEFDMPVMPKQAGNYTVQIYFNGYLAGTQDFTVTE